ncbi:MAG TPA: hypothetical protein VFA57_12195 [Pseudolabrys sp.]|nr:hypothetical protein [Pseudolabrys sp.]
MNTIKSAADLSADFTTKETALADLRAQLTAHDAGRTAAARQGATALDRHDKERARLAREIEVAQVDLADVAQQRDAARDAERAAAELAAYDALTAQLAAAADKTLALAANVREQVASVTAALAALDATARLMNRDALPQGKSPLPLLEERLAGGTVQRRSGFFTREARLTPFDPEWWCAPAPASLPLPRKAPPRVEDAPKAPARSSHLPRVIQMPRDTTPEPRPAPPAMQRIEPLDVGNLNVRLQS